MPWTPTKAKCSTCHRDIIWSISPNGARLPLDARPVTAYRLVEPDILRQGDAPQAVKVEDVVKVYVSHFTTCPQAAEHSRRG